MRVLEATEMTVVKYGSEAWTLRKADEDLLDFFPEKLLKDCSGYPADLPYFKQ
jgi:hypothetical protein